MDLVKEILTTGGIWEFIGGNKLKKEEYEPDESWIYAVGRIGDQVIGMVLIHDSPDGYHQVHVQVMPEHREMHGAEFGIKGMEWIWGNTDYDMLVASIPEIYPNVRRYAELQGFELFSTQEDSYEKDGILYSKWLMFIKR